MLELLRRHGLTLLLLAAMLTLVFTQLRPALAEKSRLQSARAAEEEALQLERDGVRRLEVWHENMADDELLRARALEELQRSPAQTGPVLVPAPDERPPEDGGLPDSEASFTGADGER